MKTARRMNTRALTSRGRQLGQPGVALWILGALVGGCSNDRVPDAVAKVDQEITAPSGSVVISEVLYDPKGQTAADAEYQYIEISGPAGNTLEGYYVVIADGRAASSGNVLAVVDLGTACSGGPCALGSDGFLMVTPALTGGQIAPSGTTQVASGYMMANNTGNGTDDISILVIESPTAAITTSMNLASDAGTLALPAGATLEDSVGWAESVAGVVFGTDVKPNNAAQDSPSAMVRISTCTTPNDAACWFYGEFANTGNGSTTVLTGITASGTGTQLPAGVTALTPGVANTAENVSGGTTNDAGAGGNSSMGGATGQGGTTVVSSGTVSAGGSTTVSSTIAAVGGDTAASTGTSPAGGATAASTGTSPTGGTTAATTTAPTATGGATSATTAAGGATTATTTAAGGATTATSATGGKSSTSTTGTKPAATTGGVGVVSTASTNSGAGSEDDGGCGCRTVGRGALPASSFAWMAALAGGLLARRRRRNY